jgi:hypothetical protein
MYLWIVQWMSRLLIRGSAKSLMRVIIWYRPFYSQNCGSMRDRKWAKDKIVMTVCQEIFWKEKWALLLGWNKDCFRSFRSSRVLTPCRNFADFVERTAVQPTWEGAAELGIPRTILTPNEILSWFTYSHRFSSMDHVTWIRKVVLDGALYFYSSYLLIISRGTAMCLLHRPMCGTS